MQKMRPGPGDIARPASAGRRVLRGKPSRRRSANGEDLRDDDGPTPICRCRVLYLGSSVPHATKDGLQGIQEPLRELYPEEGAAGAKGIDSWLSVWSNGFLLENMDENRKKVTRFFPVESLHYCAAVRYVLVPSSSSSHNDKAAGDQMARFLPLDSPFARNPSHHHPPLFAAILRRTSGIKVLECHVFICKRETAANALVRCAFHAYADSTYAKHLESGASLYGTVGAQTPVPGATPIAGLMGSADPPREYQQSVMEMSEDSINSIERVDDEWNLVGNSKSDASPRANGDGKAADESSTYAGDENHKVWSASKPALTDTVDGIYGDYGSTMRSFRSSASGMSHRHRPRQMIMPSSPPPPPIPEEASPTNGTMNGHSKERHAHDKKLQRLHRRHRSASRDSVDGPVNSTPNLRSAGGAPREPSLANGHGAPRAGSRPPPVGPYPPPPMGHPPMVMMPIPSGGGGKKSGTFSARQKAVPRGVPAPFLFYGGMPFGPPPPPHHFGMPPAGVGYYAAPPRPGSRAAEEPVYYPQEGRPLSPVASYRPSRFPHEAYLTQRGYATVDKANKNRTGPRRGSAHTENKGRRSKNPSSESNGEEDSEEDKKHMNGNGNANGHGGGWWSMNGRRSRSYGSLEAPAAQLEAQGMMRSASGKPVMINGHIHNSDMLHQMMGDLDLSDDRLERSEVPPGLYPPGPPANMMYAAPAPMMVMPQDLAAAAAAHHNAAVTTRRKKKR